MKCPCYWTSTTNTIATTNCGNTGDAYNPVADTTMSTTTTTIVYDIYSCHWECQNAASCQSFSFETGSAVCVLYDAACTATGGDSTTTNYAKSFFDEAGFTTDGICTHQKYFDEEPLKVTACKEHATETNCEAEGTNGKCYYKIMEDTLCSGGSSGTETSLTGGSGAAALGTCGDYAVDGRVCNQFWYDSTGGADTCKIYTGECTKSYSSGAGFVYQVVPCCYWTAPTTIAGKTGYGCANEDDATINGSSDLLLFSGAATGFWDLNTCHQKCQEEP
jgi:hypothetical protein